MCLVKWIDFPALGDERGELVSLEIGLEKTVPFDIKRVYYIYGTADGVSRGYHAHKNLKQVLNKNLKGVNAINLGTGNGLSVLQLVKAFESKKLP